MKLNKYFVPVAILACGSAAFSQPTTSPTPQKTMREIVMAPVVYSVVGAEKVNVKTNLKYTDAKDANLLMDVYTPPGISKSAKLPAVIFVHGAAGSEFTPKDWGIYTSWGRIIGASGMAAVTFTHRLTPRKTSMTDSAADLASAIDYVRKNADSLNLDRDRLCLAAFSAGGPLLAPVIRDKPPYIRCLVNFYAYMDVQQAGNLFTTNESKDALKTFSPIVYLDADSAKIAPIFIGRAGIDQIPTLNDSIDRFVREALAKNVSITLANHTTGIHGFDNQNDDARSREIIRMAIDFMREHLNAR